MLFAAGLGTRMGYLTKDTPKSLLKIHGKPILHYALDLCASYPFKKIVINTHYFPEAIEAFLKEYKDHNPACPQIITIHEEVLLETGGAIKNAIKIFGNKPIFTLNTDVILQVNYNVFEDMMDKWDPKKMDFLILLQPTDKAIGYTGLGDFQIDAEGNLSRPEIKGSYDFMYAGLVLLKPDLIAQNPLIKFSLKDYYLKLDRVHGVQAKNARWYHATSPDDLAEIERELAHTANKQFNRVS